MNPNPFSGLLHSRKFWLLILDTVVSTLIMVLTLLLTPAQLEFALKLIAIYQPVFVFIIMAIAYEDARIIPTKIDAEAYTRPIPKNDAPEAPVQ